MEALYPITPHSSFSLRMQLRNQKSLSDLLPHTRSLGMDFNQLPVTSKITIIGQFTFMCQFNNILVSKLDVTNDTLLCGRYERVSVFCM